MCVEQLHEGPVCVDDHLPGTGPRRRILGQFPVDAVSTVACDAQGLGELATSSAVLRQILAFCARLVRSVNWQRTTPSISKAGGPYWSKTQSPDAGAAARVVPYSSILQSL